MKKLLIVFVLLPLISICQNNKSNLEGPYFGQTPPGMKPQIFALGIFSTDDHQGSSGFNKECTHFIFQDYDLEKRRSLTYEMFRINNKWTSPKLLPFEQMMGNGDFVISPDGKTMIFQSITYIEGLEKEGRISNLWSAVKTENGWLTPEPLGGDINSKWADSFASETSNGVLYYFSRRPGGFGKSDMYKANKVNGEYQKSKNLGAHFNTEHHEWDPYIALDESYIIYCSTSPEGYGRDDFYISFKMEDGSWSKPLNMGPEINTEESENRPYVTADGKYFFYTSTIRGNRDIYWVDAKYLEKYRPTSK